MKQKRRWRDFEEAREFARSLGLGGQADWRAYAKSGKRPPDIPSSPERIYANDGWQGYGDWLGTGNVATHGRKYRPFGEAREFVRGLGLRGQKEWWAYCQSGEKPDDIPGKPHRTYAKEAGWQGYGDWLGSKHRKGGWRPFEEARAFVRSLGLKDTKEWDEYVRNGVRPTDIPARPHWVYRNAGWQGYGDWLGNGSIRRGQWRPFREARAFAHSLGLASSAEWYEYSKSGDKPRDIPAYPNEAYEETGWASWGDWLGTGYVANQRREYRSFEEAREFVRSLGIRSTQEWREYVKSGQKPDDIPANPNEVYGRKRKGRKA